MALRGFLLSLLVAALSSASSAGELERSFAVASGGQLIIALDFGSVAVERHDGDELTIEANSSGIGASSVHFDAHAEGEDVYLEGDVEPWVRMLNSEPGVRVRARVPRGVQVRVDAPSRVDVSGASIPAITP